MEDRSYYDREVKRPRQSARWMYPAAIAVLVIVVVFGLIVFAIFKPAFVLLDSLSSSGQTAGPSYPATGIEAQGALAASKGRYRDAEVLYRSAITVEPTNASYQDALGDLLVREHKPTEALPFLKKAVILDPANYDFKHDLAVAKHLQ